MRLRKTFTLVLMAAALAALTLAPTAGAVTSNGKKVALKIACAGSPGTPGTGADGVYQNPYGSPYGTPYGPPGTGKPGSGCNGRVVLRMGKRQVGKANFSLQRGQRKNVVVRLSRPARAQLAAKGRLRLKVQVNASSAVAAPRKLKVKLKARKPKA